MYHSEYAASEWTYYLGIIQRLWADDGVKMNNYFGIDWSYILYKLKQFLVMNFSWLIVGVILTLLIINLIGKMRLKKENMEIAVKEREPYAGLCGGIAAFVIFSLLYITSSLYRYNVIIAVSLCLVFVIVLQKVLGKKAEKYVWIISGIVAVAFIGQSFADIDPVSNAVFDTLETGGHKKLYSAYREEYYGDGLVNNYQYTWIDRLLNKMMDAVDYGENVDIVLPGMEASGTHVNGNGTIYEVGWNNVRKKRVIIDKTILENNPDITEISIQRTDDIIGKLPWKYGGYNTDVYKRLKDRGVVFFLPYYEEDEVWHTNTLAEYYYVGDREQQENFGGKIYYYQLLKKDNYLGFSLGDFIEGKGSATQMLEAKTPEENLYRSVESSDYESGKSVIDIGDEISFTYDAYIDGEPLPDKVKNTYYGDVYSVVIGSGRMIDGIEESMIGKAPGDTVTFEWTVPDTYLPARQYAGQTITFEFYIRSITGYVDIEHLTQEESEKILSEYNDHLNRTLDRNICNVCIDTVNEKTINPDAYPEEMRERINSLEAEIRKYLTQYLEAADITEEEFIDIYLETNDREYRQAIKDMAHAAMLFENMKAEEGTDSGS